MRLRPPVLPAPSPALLLALWWPVMPVAWAQPAQLGKPQAAAPHAGVSATCDVRTLPPAPVRAAADGEVVQALGCRDQDGEHWFVETRQAQPASHARAARLALTFSKYSIVAGGRSVRRWQARDFAELDAAPSTALTPSAHLLVKDVDLDGRLEAFIAYTLPRRDTGLDDGKLLVFYKDRKYAIRGAVAARPGDFASRTLDADFGTLPAPVQQTALGLWDRLALPATGTPGFALMRAGQPAGR